MAKYEALFEDVDDIFAGSPSSKYWDISSQLSDDLIKHEFDIMVEKMAAMEDLLSAMHDYENLEGIIKNHIMTNYEKIEELKKSLYIDLTTQLINRAPE